MLTGGKLTQKTHITRIFSKKHSVMHHILAFLQYSLSGIQAVHQTDVTSFS